MVRSEQGKLLKALEPLTHWCRGVCHLQLALRELRQVGAYHSSFFLHFTPLLQDSRRELIEAVFRALDSGGKGYLTARDMRPFAEQTGFSGSDQEWQQEFDLLRRDRGSSEGIRLDAFVSLVNDSSDDGCYCSEEELRSLLQARAQTTPPTLSKAPAPAAKSAVPKRAPAQEH